MPYKQKDQYRHKFQKAKYQIRNWKEYNQSLKSRGDITIWISEEAIKHWNYPEIKNKKRGGQSIYSDLAIETCIILGLVYKQRLRQTEGFLESIMRLMDVNLKIPDYTTVSRRSKNIIISQNIERNDESITIIIDSTGVKVYGEQEWQTEKYSTKARKIWKKLHLAINKSGKIVSSELTNHHTSDCATVEPLLKQIETSIEIIMADGAYDQPITYSAFINHQEKFENKIPIKAIIPPNLGFRAEMPNDSNLRLNNIQIFNKKGRQYWQNQTKYGLRAKVENTIYRYKTIIGNKLKSRSFLNQKIESKISIKILNIMTKLGMPISQKIR